MQYEVIDRFLEPYECDEVIRYAKKLMKPSEIYDPINNSHSVDTVHRRSEQAWVNHGATELIKKIEQRIADRVKMPVENGELFQVVHYPVGGFYKKHHDDFDENSGATARVGQRVFTFMIYLNTVAEGGETYFPNIGLRVNPVKGKAVVWKNLHDNGKRNIDALHEALPAKSDKWIMTKWVRERKFI